MSRVAPGEDEVFGRALRHIEEELSADLDRIRERIALAEREELRVSGVRDAIGVLVTSGVPFDDGLEEHLREWWKRGGMGELQVNGRAVCPPEEPR